LIKTPIYKSIWGAWSVVWESYAPRGDGTGSQLVRRFDIARTSNAYVHFASTETPDFYSICYFVLVRSWFLRVAVIKPSIARI